MISIYRKLICSIQGGKIISLENKFEEIKGSVKEGLGKLTGDNSLEAEGLAEQVVSKVKEAAEGAKETVENAIDSVKDKLK